MTTNMATGLLVRWLQTKKFLLIELERLNHRTYYTFNIIYIYLRGGGGIVWARFFSTLVEGMICLKSLSPIRNCYHSQTSTNDHLFSQQWWPNYFFGWFLFIELLVNMLEKAFYIYIYRTKHVLFPKNGVTQVSPSPPPYWPCLYNGHQSKFSILLISW